VELPVQLILRERVVAWVVPGQDEGDPRLGHDDRRHIDVHPFDVQDNQAGAALAGDQASYPKGAIRVLRQIRRMKDGLDGKYRVNSVKSIP
jgi:hypothetical protein